MPELWRFPHRTSATRWQTWIGSDPRLDKQQPRHIPLSSPLSADLSFADMPAATRLIKFVRCLRVLHPSGAQGHRLPRAFAHVFPPPAEGLFTHNNERKPFVSSELCHRLRSLARSGKVAETIHRVTSAAVAWVFRLAEPPLGALLVVCFEFVQMVHAQGVMNKQGRSVDSVGLSGGWHVEHKNVGRSEGRTEGLSCHQLIGRSDSQGRSVCQRRQIGSRTVRCSAGNCCSTCQKPLVFLLRVRSCSSLRC